MRALRKCAKPPAHARSPNRIDSPSSGALGGAEPDPRAHAASSSTAGSPCASTQTLTARVAVSPGPAHTAPSSAA